MSSDKPTDDTALLGLVAGVALAEPTLGALFGAGWLLKKTVPASVRAAASVARGSAKATGKLLQASKPTPRPQRPPTPRQLAEAEKHRLVESLRIIDSLPLGKDEKEAMREHARRKLMKRLWEIMK